MDFPAFLCLPNMQETPDVNAVKSKLMGGYLRNRLLGNGNSKHAAKELVKRSFRLAEHNSNGDQPTVIQPRPS